MPKFNMTIGSLALSTNVKEGLKYFCQNMNDEENIFINIDTRRDCKNWNNTNGFKL